MLPLPKEMLQMLQILCVRFLTNYEFGPSVFYLFAPSVKNWVLRFSIYSVLQIRSTVPARTKNPRLSSNFITFYLLNLLKWAEKIIILWT